MTKPIRFAREARAEALTGRWYDSQRRGLQAEFLASLDEALDRVLVLGRHVGSVPGVNPSLGYDAS